MKECIFCKIAKGKIFSMKVWEDDDFLAFLDINPYCKGHVLIIPKKHAKWVWDLDDKTYSGIFEKIHYLTKVLKKAFNIEWVELIIAGIGVEHAHIHLLPRRFDDGFGEIPIKPMKPKPSEEDLKKVAEKIKKFI